MELNIPYIFTALNEYFASGDQEKLAPILELPGEQQPRGCVGCGLCQERCPEHIDASGWMLKARTLLESVER